MEIEVGFPDGLGLVGAAMGAEPGAIDLHESMLEILHEEVHLRQVVEERGERTAVGDLAEEIAGEVLGSAMMQVMRRFYKYPPRL